MNKINMEINILAFGQITEITGKSSWKISNINSTDELNKKLNELFPALATLKYAMAVNRQVIQQNIELKNEDTIALLPPFSGG